MTAAPITARETDELPPDAELAQLVRTLLGGETRPCGGPEDVKVGQVWLDACGKLQRACRAAPRLGERMVVHIACVLDG